MRMSFKYRTQICAGIIWAGSLVGAYADQAKQHEVETAFIYQFTNYIQWPNFDTSGSSTFVISVVGDTEMFESLEKLAKNKMVNKRPVQVHNISSVSDIKKSNIVVLAAAEPNTLKEAIRKLKGSGALLVTHADGFAKKGAMINFFIDEGRLRFEINPSSLQNEGLKVSSQLLKLAKIVD